MEGHEDSKTQSGLKAVQSQSWKTGKRNGKAACMVDNGQRAREPGLSGRPQGAGSPQKLRKYISELHGPFEAWSGLHDLSCSVATLSHFEPINLFVGAPGSVADGMTLKISTPAGEIGMKECRVVLLLAQEVDASAWCSSLQLTKSRTFQQIEGH